jgi:hypothetical protein
MYFSLKFNAVGVDLDRLEEEYFFSKYPNLNFIYADPVLSIEFPSKL